MPHPRKSLMLHLQKFFKGHDNGRYSFVHRGPVNWATHDFKKHKWSVAIMCDQTSIFPRRTSPGIGSRDMVLAFEIAVRWDGESGEGLDDTLTDVIMEDAEAAINSCLEPNPEDVAGAPYIFRRVEGSDSLVEFHDASKGVQGGAVNIQISY